MAIGQEEIGRRIAEAREAAELSQRQLADRIGLADAQSISRYERGVTEVSTRRLERIAEATGKPMNFFVMEIPGDRDPAPPAQEQPSNAELRAEIAAVRQLLERLSDRLDREQPQAGSSSP